LDAAQRSGANTTVIRLQTLAFQIRFDLMPKHWSPNGPAIGGKPGLFYHLHNVVENSEIYILYVLMM
jgi:hypothetical protein